MPQKNLCAKTVTREQAYEVWSNGTWTWYVLKKWQVDDDKPFARWYCNVVSPMTSERGETGDVYVADIKAYAVKLDSNPLTHQHEQTAAPPF